MIEDDEVVGQFLHDPGFLEVASFDEFAEKGKPAVLEVRVDEFLDGLDLLVGDVDELAREGGQVGLGEDVAEDDPGQELESSGQLFGLRVPGVAQEEGEDFQEGHVSEEEDSGDDGEDGDGHYGEPDVEAEGVDQALEGDSGGCG